MLMLKVKGATRSVKRKGSGEVDVSEEKFLNLLFLKSAVIYTITEKQNSRLQLHMKKST